MQLITLNTWGGRVGREALGQFFETYRDHTDVICLQEIWNGSDVDLATGQPIKLEQVIDDGVDFLTAILPNYNLYFRPHYHDYGILTAVQRNLKVISEGEQFVHQHKNFIPAGEAGHHARNIQHLTFDINGQPLTIINFHGLWNGQGKGDTPDRLEQSRRILEYTSTLNHPYIMCGDFNLTPDTQSIKILEQSGLRNLITEYGITSTRTSHYTKEPKFADYILVSDGIEVQGFEVLPEEVSDHAAIRLEFDI